MLFRSADKKGKKGPKGYQGYDNAIFTIKVSSIIYKFNIPIVNLQEGLGGKGGLPGIGQSCWQGNQLVIGGNDGPDGDRGNEGKTGKLEIFLKGVKYYPSKK